ncbi:hypothetical protein BKA69DRAFT_1125275 [Paraphysoderma sedebokerense]|nr:hypothetical protein BKA69DRAFT_1125275 [Paraphysoderma sedebokerense]
MQELNYFQTNDFLQVNTPGTGNYLLSGSLDYSPISENLIFPKSRSPSITSASSSRPSRSPSVSGQSSMEAFFEYPVSPTEPSKSSNKFVHKLFRMVNDETCNHLINWSGCGTSFVVNDIATFSQEILPQHFNHSNFSSFLRQLNFYGFTKVIKTFQNVKRSRVEADSREFSHPCFLFNRPDLLGQIKRRGDSEAKKPEADDMAIKVSILQQQNNQLMFKIESLESKLELLSREFSKQEQFQHNLRSLSVEATQNSSTVLNLGVLDYF